MAKVVDTLYIALGIDASKLDKGLAIAQSKLAVGLKSAMSKVFAPPGWCYAFLWCVI